MREINDFIDGNSPEGISVYQITDDPKGAGMVYPDQPSFLADGRRFVVHTSSGPAICDPDDGCSLQPVFGEGKDQGIQVTFDGRYGYYAQHENGLTISRVDLETLKTEDLFHGDGTVPGTKVPLEKLGVNTISSDNRRVATAAWIGDGVTPDGPTGIIVLDLDSGEARVVAEDRDFCNPHLQYCRSTDPDASHDLLIQMNHGTRLEPDGKAIITLGPPSDLGVDIHVVRDDGTNWRDMPFGRDGHESCIGHQIWRGLGTSAATVTLQNEDTSYGWAEGAEQGVVAGWAQPADKNGLHLGLCNPGARRVVLSAGFPRPRFCHLACDTSGLKFVFDTFPIYDGRRAGMHVYIGSAPDEETPLTFRYILNSGVVFPGKISHMHAHPVLSPDGSRLFFNSDVTGLRQAYMVTGFTW